MKVYDAVLFAGTVDELVQRFEVLDQVVDVFVVVEPAKTRSGQPRRLVVREQLAELEPWIKKLRHVVFNPAKPMTTRQWQQALRNEVTRGLADADSFDQVMVSDWRVTPSVDAVKWMCELAVEYGRLATRIPSGRRIRKSLTPVCFQAQALDRHHAAVLCQRALKKGWYPSGPAGTAAWVRKDHHRWWRREEQLAPAAALITPEPVIICSYLYDEDAVTIRDAFGLNDDRGKDLPFFLWQDSNRIGAERAFQYCWEQFPDRDIIIVHPDMRPMPDDQGNHWYRQLQEYVAQLPDAGIIGCDLIFPEPTKTGELAAQCVGGRIKAGQIKHVGGRNRAYDHRYTGVRKMDWATFGGVYIRRETIQLVGSFDDAYKWAYVADVDYCMQTYMRGLRIYQVPVNLIHEQNGTTKDFLVDEIYLQKRRDNEETFAIKWSKLFRGAPSATRRRVGGWSRFPGA